MQTQNRKLNALIRVAFHLEAPVIIEGYVRMASVELESRGHEVTICRDTESALEVFRDNLDAFEGGLSMINVFDRERGY